MRDMKKARPRKAAERVRAALFLALTVFLFCTAFILAGCFSSDAKTVTVVYHLNGGEADWLDEDGNYTVTVTKDDCDRGISPMRPERETWIFEGWFLEDDLQTAFLPPRDQIPAEWCDGRTVHLYAKWTDKIVITPQNFSEHFVFKKNWNGGLNDINAAVDWSIAPKTANDYSNGEKYVFDPKSQTIRLTMHGNGHTWDLDLDANSYFEAAGTVSGFSAGQTVGGIEASVFCEVNEGAYEIYLLHKAPFRVTVDPAGGTYPGPTEFECLGGEIFAYDGLPAPTKEGYRFTGWRSEGHADGKPVIQDATVTAQWTKEHVVSYETYGGVVPDKTLLDGDRLVLPRLTREGFEFFGWYYDAEFEQPIEYDTYSQDDENIYTYIPVHADMTIYARFEPIYTIAFDTDGGTDKAPIEIARTKTPALGDSPVKQGLCFGGWYLDKDHKEPYTSQPVSKDLVLYAQWLKEVAIDEANIKDFFDIETSAERTAYTTPSGATYGDALKVTLTVSLKQVYRGYRFYLYNDRGATIAFHKAHSGECGKVSENTDPYMGNTISDKYVLSNCLVSYGTNGTEVRWAETAAYEFAYEEYRYGSSQVEADHVYAYYFGKGSFYIPEGTAI